MTQKNKSKLRVLTEPYLTREPLFIRFCAAFVDNLAMILRVTLVMGGIFLARELPVLMQETAVPDDSPANAVASSPDTKPAAAKPNEAILSDGVKQAYKCTFEDYRNEHYDACVAEESDIYKRPNADPDDTGFVLYDVDTLYASAAQSR